MSEFFKDFLPIWIQGGEGIDFLSISFVYGAPGIIIELRRGVIVKLNKTQQRFHFLGHVVRLRAKMSLPDSIEVAIHLRG